MYHYYIAAVLYVYIFNGTYFLILKQFTIYSMKKLNIQLFDFFLLFKNIFENYKFITQFFYPVFLTVICNITLLPTSQ